LFEKLHFCAGMPRAGSTLLMNILAQNPEIHATATSSLVEAVLAVKNSWDNWPENRAMALAESEKLKHAVLKAMVLGTYSNLGTAPVVVDKNRIWLAEAEMLETLLGEKPKFLICVRPVLDVLASFEMLWRTRNKGVRQVPQETANKALWQTVEGRCQTLLRLDEVVGSCFNRVKDALARGWQRQMLFVEFDRLTACPAAVLAEVYDFLGLKPFEHDFEHVVQATHEDDSAYGWLGLHDIREKVLPVKSRWKEVLAPFLSAENLKAYRDQSVFWKET
jgi:sulfotransferase